MPRAYRLGRRQAAVDATGDAIVAAARGLVASGVRRPTAAAIARRADVSRATVYSRFGTVGALLDRLAPPSRPPAVASQPRPQEPREELHGHFHAICAAWATSPALFRHLPRPPEPDSEAVRAIVQRLAADDALRPGCSLKEAEDVIGVLSAFATFDRLHRDGRRPPAAVAEILMRLASATLA